MYHFFIHWNYGITSSIQANRSNKTWIVDAEINEYRDSLDETRQNQKQWQNRQLRWPSVEIISTWAICVVACVSALWVCESDCNGLCTTRALCLCAFTSQQHSIAPATIRMWKKTYKTKKKVKANSVYANRSFWIIHLCYGIEATSSCESKQGSRTHIRHWPKYYYTVVVFFFLLLNRA